jgi:hypothetical protein
MLTCGLPGARPHHPRVQSHGRLVLSNGHIAAAPSVRVRLGLASIEAAAKLEGLVNFRHDERVLEPIQQNFAHFCKNRIKHGACGQCFFLV